MVHELATRGISFVQFDDLFTDRQRWDHLCLQMQGFVSSDKVKKWVESYRQRFREATLKEYLVPKFSEGEVISPDDPWLRFGLEPMILDIVNSYLGMWAKLNGLNLWYTIPLEGARPPIGAQRWHRDPEDVRFVKVFLYFSDVDEGAGPLQYLPGSRVGGPYQDLWPLTTGIGTAGYPPAQKQKEIEEKIPDSAVATCVGSQGTFVFCDTTGLHRGGFATQRDRSLAFWIYVTPASLWPRKFKLDRNRDGNWARFSEAARYALA